jgi:hypothetical protein
MFVDQHIRKGHVSTYVTEVRQGRSIVSYHGQIGINDRDRDAQDPAAALMERLDLERRTGRSSIGGSRGSSMRGRKYPRGSVS